VTAPSPRRRHTRATLLSHTLSTLAIAAIAACTTVVVILGIAGEAR
jgi:hypothetical protein